MFFSLFTNFTKKKKNTDYNEMDSFIEKEYCDDIKETTVVSEEEDNEENKEDAIKKARDLLKEAIKIFT
jgi:hypothetical protein